MGGGETDGLKENGDDGGLSNGRKDLNMELQWCDCGRRTEMMYYSIKKRGRGCSGVEVVGSVLLYVCVMEEGVCVCVCVVSDAAR